MQSYLTSFKQIDAVWASDDDMALGCETAIREAHREGEMWMLGGAGMKAIVKKVMNNMVYYNALFEDKPQSLKSRLGIIRPRGNGDAGADALP